MSSVARLQPRALPARKLVLLGTGGVGSAFVARYQRLRQAGLALPDFAWLANSRALGQCGESAALALGSVASAPRGRAWTPAADIDALDPGDVIVDATASEAVAGSHAQWLHRGVHVVTANKLGYGASLARAQAISRALQSGAGYGDSATVGAGLPLLQSLRALVAGGDRIHRVEGVLSGSLAWLFHQYDGTRPFSELVREAGERGFTEPDPRLDLAGEDVRRKLLILARASGLPLAHEAVRVESLVPAVLAAASATEVANGLHHLDAPLAVGLGQARRQGNVLRFIGSFDASGARVGLQALPSHHPLCGGAGTDNRVAIFSDRYREQPLLIQGPGAGVEVTAAALIDDVVRLAR